VDEDLGLLDTIFNRESKLLERAKKGLSRVDSLEAGGKHAEALAELEKTAALVQKLMASAYELDIPLSTEARWGPNWDDMTVIA